MKYKENDSLLAYRFHICEQYEEQPRMGRGRSYVKKMRSVIRRSGIEGFSLWL